EPVEGKVTAATPTPSSGGGDDADSDHEFNLVIDENPQRTPGNKQNRTASTEEKRKSAKRKRDSEATEEQETDAKRAKRNSVAATRKSTDVAKSTDSTTNSATSVTPNAAAAAIPQSPPKPELISRSGRKIKPKKFLDEEEGGGGGGIPPEANGSPKAGTPKPAADGEGKQTPLRGSKRLSSAKTNATDETTSSHENEQSEEQLNKNL
ncbi:hypothetical protein L9F63_009189, partial [Diploptera punctata]